MDTHSAKGLKAIRALEVSFATARARIERLSEPEKVAKAIEHENDRTDLKTFPLGTFTLGGKGYEFSPDIGWATYYAIEASLPS